jgi:hypothetical protein
MQFIGACIVLGTSALISTKRKIPKVVIEDAR